HATTCRRGSFARAKRFGSGRSAPAARSRTGLSGPDHKTWRRTDRQSASGESRRVEIRKDTSADPLTDWKPLGRAGRPCYEGRGTPRIGRGRRLLVGGLRRTASDPVRECRVALWAWPGGAARPQFWDQWAILPVPHRSLGRRQNLAAAAHAAVAATEPRPDQHVRTGYG